MTGLLAEIEGAGGEDVRRRAREAILDKLNMIIGTFFSECGTGLLGARRGGHATG